MAKQTKRIILASASPRRRELMKDMGLDFAVKPADIDESNVTAKKPRMLVKKLSLAKAEAMRENDAIIIGADTVVVYGGKVFGKPHTEENAVRMLKSLCGRWHKVYTGVSVLDGDKTVSFAVKSLVKLRDLNAEEIEEYVERDKPLDKAGAYGIQDGLLVEKYRGSFTNIVGLPKEKLARVLAGFGVDDVNG